MRLKFFFKVFLTLRIHKIYNCLHIQQRHVFYLENPKISNFSYFGFFQSSDIYLFG